jgi:hypothetical protein
MEMNSERGEVGKIGYAERRGNLKAKRKRKMRMPAEIGTALPTII